MAPRPLRFIHAGDLALHQPVGGLAEIPDRLIDLLWKAPYRTAERLADLALAEAVDFVLLCGEQVLPERSGPRGPLALCQQFERLRQHGIRVYWAGAPAWPAAFALPDNVYRFPRDRVAEVYHHREQQPVARIVGCGSAFQAAGDLMLGASPLFTIAVCPEMPGRVAHGTVDYWACGGQAGALGGAWPLSAAGGLAQGGGTLAAGEAVSMPGMLGASGAGKAASSDAVPNVFQAGKLQGRSPREVGPHGCLVATVGESGRDVVATFVPCDALRWLHIRLPVEKSTTREELVRAMELRVSEAQAGCRDLPLLYTVTLSGAGVPHELRSEACRHAVAAMLRQQGASAPAWCVSIQVEPDATALARALEEDTLLGMYLRAVGGLLEQQETGGDMPDIAADLPEEAQSLAPLVRLAGQAGCQRVLREAAALGLSVLSAEEPLA